MLSIVAIGKNEASNLPRLIASLAGLKKALPFEVETIFVDSASTDDSLRLATGFFDTIVSLEKSPHLCAGAGRFAGTLEANHEWIFYIDADMAVSDEFREPLRQFLETATQQTGLIGLYCHHFDNGRVAVQSFSYSRRKPDAAAQFGGAVVLRREAVLLAGNWDPSIYGKEEMELYVRLGSGRPVVQFIGVPMVQHFTEHYSKTELLLRLLTPAAGLGKVYYGYGQTVRALSIKGKLRALFLLEKEAHFVWIALSCLLLVTPLIGPATALAALAGMLAFFVYRLRLGRTIRYLTLPLSLATGWFQYFPWFRPRLTRWGSTAKTAQ